MAKSLTLEELANMKPRYRANGYPVPKWILFSETMIRAGCGVRLHRAVTTRSKYLYVKRNHKIVKVRFSDHKANYYQEQQHNSDFYVGRGNKGTITTGQVIPLVLNKLQKDGG